MAKNQKSYTPEFKQQIVDLYNAGGTSYPQLEREYGVNRSTISGWVKQLSPIKVSDGETVSLKSAVCNYTEEGRALIHTGLNLDFSILKDLREQTSNGHSTEYMDCRISLFSAQHGKCAISGEEFVDASSVVGWLKKPKDKGGFERYGNMVLIHERYLQLLQDLGQQELKATAKTIKATKKMISKINRLREQAELPTIG